MDGLYLSFSNEIMVCRVTPSRLASCCCVSPRALRFFRNAVFHVYTSFQKVKLALHQHYNASAVNVKLILHLRFKFYGKAVGRGPEKAPDEAGSAGSPDRDADERSRICETGWEPERAGILPPAKGLTESTQKAVTTLTKKRISSFQYAQEAKKKIASARGSRLQR